ncbi:MAG: hypothetical protein ROO76_01790 [Terriglobia bacterium]|nr:hypothetical protein [Terriglobia bacterium]
MTGLPKSVRDQMARTPAPPSHPDADLLTAFAENALSGKARQHIVDHLSVCAECRDIVFLAQPASVETQIVLAPKPRRFTRMAWVSAAAVVVIVGSAVLIQHKQVTKIETPATATAPARPETSLAENPSQGESAPPAIAEDREHTFAGKSKEVAKIKTPASAPIIPKPEIADEARVTSPSAASASLPSAAGGVVGGVVGQQNVNGPQQQNALNRIPQQANPANDKLPVANEKATQAPPVAAMAAKKPQAQRNEFHGLATGYVAGAAPIQSAIQASVRAHWRISKAGTLEHSYTADDWTPVLTETGAKFYVVAVLANTVWAGGERGALYVSNDGGTNWTPITIDTTDTITSIHFSDELHGIIRTKDGPSWKTSDGGKTWEKQ